MITSPKIITINNRINPIRRSGKRIRTTIGNLQGTTTINTLNMRRGEHRIKDRCLPRHRAVKCSYSNTSSRVVPGNRRQATIPSNKYEVNQPTEIDGSTERKDADIYNNA